MNEEFEKIFSKLTISEQNKVNETKINTIFDLFPLLLNRVSKENIDNLVSLLKQSILPSICSKKDEGIEELFNKIDKDTDLLFNKEIQNKIQEFIEKRFYRDKQIVIQRTTDLSEFVSLMGQYLNDAITSNGSSSKNVLNIKKKIKSINLTNDNISELTTLQNELVNAASSIEEEMNTVTNKLQIGKTKVQELEYKVNALEKALLKSRDESRKDYLTGLLTRRAYNEKIKEIESSYERHNIQYALVFFDLDFFKKINDTYGHECGDVILSTFAKVLEKNTRDHDIVGRYGGEEFIVIIHYNLEKELIQYLRRIKTIVTTNNFKYKEYEIRVTFSAGVTLRSNHKSYENTIQKADMLLYAAKENGRNQIKLENGKTI